MLEPLSLTASLLGLAGVHARARLGGAVSSEASAVRTAAAVIMKAAEGSQALFGRRAMAITELWSVAGDCAEPDWDASGACPLSIGAIRCAEDFLRALPDGLPMPEVAPAPDGSVSLDWLQSRHRMFTLSVGDGSRLAYAWLDGADKGHGVARFDGTTVPARILAGIHGVVSGDNVALRTA